MSQPILVALQGAKGSFSISTTDLVLQMYMATSSDDSRVDRIMCAGSPLVSRLFLGWCNGVMDSARDFDLLGESVL